MFEKLKNQMQECLSMDPESGYAQADEILIDLALNTKLTKKERQQIIDIYRKVDKWFS